MDQRTACVFGATGGIGSALVRALATRDDVAVVHAGGRVLPELTDRSGGDKVRPFRFDLGDQASIGAAAEDMAATPPDLVVVATGVLAFPDGTAPEKTVRALDADRMAEMFMLNTIGPALIAKHMLPRFARDRRAVFVALSARVGSIGENRLGGWHSYRASKAALNMLVRNFGIEMRRTHPQAVVAALHPGTVDTLLSREFQRNLPPGQLTEASQAAARLIGVIDALSPADSGGFFGFDGRPIAF
jgi:NAD(P)-dependent dehydrogenase (short-subunit alcohol dehydrogenase family)